ncbi:MAG: 16S rRNA (cytosine(1402)-N(4))-methyltransferase RsmH [Deltaproteobacteria bacterium]|nr:16S rRNA (cytosine(1402)-N(4))-methyltransferase RsmH [Deltaproteobacteria bacterium]
MADHVSVLLEETVSAWVTDPDGIYLDGTGGYGGHTSLLLKKLGSKAKVFVCDYHLPTAKLLQSKFAEDDRVTVFHQRFSRVLQEELLEKNFDGILVDLGISSPQLAEADLGIGFLLDDAPLDMRIDHRLEKTAADLLQEESEEDLADMFFYFGGERYSRKIAAAIVHDREKGVVYKTTSELRDLCDRVLGRFYRQKKIHAATKVFQALRIAVNQELKELELFLELAPQHLKPNGHLAVIAFHSGEDRMVKTKFRDLAMEDGFALPKRKAIKPSAEEIDQNPRARSARLRVLERRSL